MEKIKTHYSKNNSKRSKKKVKINEKEYIVQLWDTAGQEKFRSVSKIYFKDSDIVIFVYDITNEKSFNDLGEFWINYVKELIGNDIVYGIASNKIDLFENKEVEMKKKKEKRLQRIMGRYFVKHLLKMTLKVYKNTLMI